MKPLHNLVSMAWPYQIVIASRLSLVSSRSCDLSTVGVGVVSGVSFRIRFNGYCDLSHMHVQVTTFGLWLLVAVS